MNIAGSLSYDTKLDTNGFEKGFNKLSSVSVAVGNIMAQAFTKAVSAIGDIGNKAINLASDLEEVQNVVDVTFGKDASKINEWSKQASTSFGMSELSAKKFNGTMGAMLKSMGLTEDEVLNMSTKIVGLAGDMASFYNLDHQEAFNKIRAGISGETEPLKQLGINMSVANLEAYALSKGIKKSYSAMTESEKATLRYNYLMKTTADAQGDFARTSDSFANQQRILQLNFENLTASIGEKVLPTITDIITLINDVLTGGEKVSKWIEDNKQPLTLLAILIGTITTALIAYTIAQNALTIATTIATTVSTAFGAVMAFITSPITLVVLAIGALIAIGYLLITNWEKVKETAIKVFNYIGNFVGSIINKIKEIFKGAFDIGNNLVKGLWNGINNAKDWILNKIKGFGKDVLNGLKDFFGIHSPSKLFQNEIGDNLILGVGVAFDKDSKLIDKQIKEFGDDVFNKMSNAVNLETGKMAFSGTSGSVSEILNANSQFTGNINNVLELDGEVVYSNQQTIKARKELQYGGV